MNLVSDGDKDYGEKLSMGGDEEFRDDLIEEVTLKQKPEKVME